MELVLVKMALVKMVQVLNQVSPAQAEIFDHQRILPETFDHQRVLLRHLPRLELEDGQVRYDQVVYGLPE